MKGSPSGFAPVSTKRIMHSYLIRLSLLLCVGLCFVSAAQDTTLSSPSSQGSASGELTILQKRYFSQNHQSLEGKDSQDKNLDLLTSHKHRLSKLELLQQIIMGSSQRKRRGSPHDPCVKDFMAMFEPSPPPQIFFGQIDSKCPAGDHSICVRFDIPRENLRSTCPPAIIWLRSINAEEDPFGMEIWNPHMPEERTQLKPFHYKFDLTKILHQWSERPELPQRVVVSCRKCGQHNLSLPINTHEQPMLKYG